MTRTHLLAVGYVLLAILVGVLWLVNVWAGAIAAGVLVVLLILRPRVRD
jgi:4-hydroxybenzoate polyprenyltransferase